MERSVERMKSELSGALSHVEGWLDLEMAWVLHETARCFPASSPYITIIEIGCWKGRSTIALALGLKARGGGKVYAIDPHTGTAETIYLCGQVDTYGALIENIKAAGLTEFVEPIRTTSHLARDRFQDNSVHLLLVDGSHEHSEFIEYVDDWNTALTEGAIVAFRDPFWDYRALSRRVLRWHSPFRNPTLFEDDTLLLEFERQKRWTYQDSVALLLLAVQHLVHASRRAKAFRKHMPDLVKSIFEAVDSTLGRLVSGGRQSRYLAR